MSNDEWGTPPEWIALAREVMGGIDLDPASNAAAQAIVQAGVYYDASDDCLAPITEWFGRVWLNPPYSQPLCREMLARCVREVRVGNVQQACVLVNNATDTIGVQGLLDACDAVLFPAGRISYIDPITGRPSKGNRYAQLLAYFGDEPGTAEFVRVMRPHGVVLVPARG